MNYYIYEVDIHAGHPFVEEAMEMFEEELEYAKERNVHVLKVVTGYGSQGGTHRIQDELLMKLISLKCDGEIVDYIKGNELSFHHSRLSNKLTRMIPATDKRIANPGVVYIFLRRS